MRAHGLLLALVVLVALVALAVAGCGGGQEAQETTATPHAETETQPRDTSRTAAPPIEGETLDGEPLSLADFRGKPVLVNVWAAW